MKSLARLHVWWSTLDQDIEQTVRDCPNCQFNRCKYPFKVSNPWIWPTSPWQRIHADFVGPMHDGLIYLIVVDAKSKWMAIVSKSSTTTAVTPRALRFLFSLHGLPEEIVSDNGPQFVSQEMKDFLKFNGFASVYPHHIIYYKFVNRRKFHKQGVRQTKTKRNRQALLERRSRIYVTTSLSHCFPSCGRGTTKHYL